MAPGPVSPKRVRMEAGRIGGRKNQNGSGPKRGASRWSAIRVADAPAKKQKPIYEGGKCGIVVPPVGRPREIPVARKKKTGFRLTRPGLLMEVAFVVR